MAGVPVSTSALSPVLVGAVLFAALLHAIWNSCAHAIGDRLVGFALIGIAATLGGGVLVAVGGLPPAASWPFVLASAATHVVYNLLLMASYQLGEFSQTYPLARGTAPWVVALASVYLLHRSLPPAQLAGVLVISVGLAGLVLAGGRPGRARLPALGASVATGMMIALYTVIDGVGVTRTPLLAYIGWMFLLQGPPLPVLAALRRSNLLARLRVAALPGLAGGFISLAAYSIVLWAQTSGALAPIAALRESSIVFGSLIVGAVFLGERLGHRRAVASAVVLAGVLVLAGPL
jgi:drug/metabolite transporter (DMT)-like permease